MATLLADPIRRGAVAVPPARPFVVRTTLDDILVRAWEGLSAASIVGCPVCGGAMMPRRTTDGPGGMLRVAGRCRSCDSQMS